MTKYDEFRFLESNNKQFFLETSSFSGIDHTVVNSTGITKK
jgi:hypothetical protein